MKEIEELLDKMLLCSEEHLQSGVNEPTKYAELRAEIIKRFDELEKFYKHTHKVEYVAGITRPYEQKIAELEEQVEKLKCCGNCTSFMIDDHHVLYCENDVYPFPILGKCDRWEASHAATPLRRMGL